MEFRLVLNPLHPAVSPTEAVQGLLVYYFATILMAIGLGVDVTSVVFIGTISAVGIGIGIIKAWQRRFSPVAPIDFPTE